MGREREARVAIALYSVFAGGLANACTPALTGDNLHRIEGTTVVVAWRPDPAPLRQGDFFALDIAACLKDAASNTANELRVDAVMPEHKHGMNYRPTVTALGNGRFRAEGLLLHMPGLWEFSFDVRAANKQETLRERVTLQ
jgi:hypothetical protein